MRILKRRCKYGGLILLLGGVIGFAYFLTCYPNHLIHKEQILLFVYTTEAFWAYWDKPAILSCLAGDFLTQFFYSPTIASALLALMIFLTGLSSFMVLRKWFNDYLAVGFGGLIMIGETLRSSSLLYPLSATISLIGGCAFFLLYDRIKDGKARIVAGIIVAVLGYVLIGYGIFLFLFFLLIDTLARRETVVWTGLTIGLLVLFLIPISDKYLLTFAQSCSYPATTGWEKSTPLYEHLLALDMEGLEGNWSKIRELSFPDPRISACTYYYNLANAAEGSLADGLLNYYQPGTDGLFLPISSASSYLSSLFASEVWFRLGDMTMAEHATILGMIFSPRYKGSRMIKRLAEINLINGDDEAAMKYLRILSKTLLYREWAQERIPGKESEAISRWLAEKRKYIPRIDTVRTSTADIVKSLRLLLKTNPDNQMARDYLLCNHLLSKDLMAFIQDYRPEVGQVPKRLYAEALMIDLVRRHATGEEIKAAIVDPSIVQDFKAYTRMHQQSKGDPHPLMSMYGKTYWFYFHYGQNN